MAVSGHNSTTGEHRAGLVIIVPTTAGAITIKGLRWTQKIPTSRVVLGNETADQCERWTKEYNNLLRPGDPMRTLLGLPESGGFRLVVTSEIDHGKSWIMPVAAAHFGASLGEALHADLPKARLMIWTTGALDFALAESASAAKVVANDYQLISKIDHSRDLFAAAAHAGTPVLCILPEGGDAERTSAVLAKVLAGQQHHVAVAGSLADLIAPLDGFLKGGDFSAMAARRKALVPFAEPAEKKARGPEPDQPAAATSGYPQGHRSADTPSAQSASSMTLRKAGIMAAAVLTLAGTGAGAYLLMQKPKAPGSIATGPVTPPVPAPGGTIIVSAPPTAPPLPKPETEKPPVTAPAQVVARLTVLQAPAGSSCRALAYDLQPRFTETTIDLVSDKPVADIDDTGICGLSVAGTGTIRVRFVQNSIVGSVPSLSGPNRVIFNPITSPDRFPTVQLEGASLARIELKRR